MSSNSDAATPPPFVDSTPLLGDRIFTTHPRFLRRIPSLRGTARFLRRASSRGRSMRETSVRVRETAAEQIEERQNDWAYSKPIVILDLAWNVAFVFITISVLIASHLETPSMPLRLWIIGYALQCLIHMACVCLEYKKRLSQRAASRAHSRNFSNSSSGSGDDAVGFVPDRQQSDDEINVSKHVESANTMFSFIWWIVGFYWVSAGGQTLIDEAPHLYWFCIVFLAFDVFFVVICVAVACVIGLAVCCCLPCIIALLYAVGDQEGATKEEIERLPKYIFRKLVDFEKETGEIQESFGGIMTECDSEAPVERVLAFEHAECCICICSYDDGTELRELPCHHHFHAACIDKWLHIRATCPLCKLNILKSGNQSGSEDV